MAASAHGPASMMLVFLLVTTAAEDVGELGGRSANLPELSADDECLATGPSGGGERCALNALQRRGSQKTVAVKQHLVEADAANPDGAPQWAGGCENCMQENFAPMAEEDLGASPIGHYALNCWSACGGAGPCAWCGAGNACCRYRYATDPAACHGVRMWPVLSFHTCVQMASAPAPSLPAPAPSPSPSPSNTFTPAPSSGTYQPQLHALAMPSDASPLTFYMYRAVGGSDFPPENVNTANLAGVMWYLHNEVVVQTPRKFGITRILRMKVTTKATQPLLDAGMNFGVRYAFDSGECTGPWSCSEQFQRYGYFVGCNNVGEFPTAMWHAENHYDGAVWYSLPGPCSSRRYNSHDDACVASSPGGACSGGPTGRGDCTYSYEMAGEISIAELEGIADYQLFIAQGNKEYDRHLDRGIGMSFWNDKHDAAKCQQRVQAAEALFAAKYGTSTLPVPKCDFNYGGFFG